MPVAIGRARQGVERLLRQERPFEEIETAIENFDGLDNDQRAALWLLAWSEMGADTRRRIAEEAISVSSPPAG
jgi:hypothetical protein